MKDNYDFSEGRKNPYAKKLKEEGYSILIHYSPNDTAQESDSINKEMSPGEGNELDECRAK